MSTATQPPRTPPATTRLYRSREDRVLGGVAAGIARYLGTDGSFAGPVLLVALGGLLLARGR